MDLVRQLRLKRGWSQEHLAEVADVGRATVQRLERGRIRPTWETAQALAQALDVEPSRIRSCAGLAALVSATLEITLTREPSDGELRRLPGAERAIFRRYREARFELVQAGTEAERQAAEFARTLEVDLADLADLAHAASEDGRATRQAAKEGFFAAQRRVSRALAAHMEAGMAVLMLRLRFM